MIAARRLAAILVADVGVREHRDGRSEHRAKGSFAAKQSPAGLAQGGPPRPRWPDPERTLVASDQWRGSVDSKCGAVTLG